MPEHFTMQSSLYDIINNPRMTKLPILFNPIYYSNVKPFFQKMKLKNMVKMVKTPWGKSINAEGLLCCANFILDRREAGEPLTISVWQGVDDPELDKVVLVPFVDKTRKDAPCVIICPGGAYNRVAFHNEGIPVAEKLFDMGYQVFILSYRVAPCGYPKPQQDLVRAIRFVRKNHEKLGVNPEAVTIMGFSAGGHLCASVGALYDQIPDETHRYDDVSARPDRICLCYPLISLLKDPHVDCNKNLLGDTPAQEMLEKLSIENLVTADYPQTLIWACEDDPTVPVTHTKLMMEVLKDKGVSFDGHVYPSGGHGIGLGNGTSAEGWIGMLEL